MCRPRALATDVKASETQESATEDPGDWSSPAYIHSPVLMAVTLVALYLLPDGLAVPAGTGLGAGIRIAARPCVALAGAEAAIAGVAAGVLVLLAGVGVWLPAMLVADRLVDEVARGGGALRWHHLIRRDDTLRRML